VFLYTSASNHVSEQNFNRWWPAASRVDNELRRWGGSKLTAVSRPGGRVSSGSSPKSRARSRAPRVRCGGTAESVSGVVEMFRPPADGGHRWKDRSLPTCSQFFRLYKSFHKKRNWIHIGIEEAGPRVAAIVSVVETCRRLKIPIRDYLLLDLAGIGSINRIAELTPSAWLARN
jgi:hypothetical protein